MTSRQDDVRQHNEQQTAQTAADVEHLQHQQQIQLAKPVMNLRTQCMADGLSSSVTHSRQ